MIKKKLTKVIAIVLIIAGLFLIYLTIRAISLRNTPVDFSQAGNNQNLDTTLNYPITIEFTNLSLVLPISNKNVINGKWDDPQNTVGYWIDSPLPGEKGNSIMYGHNWPNLLSKLPKINPGDEIKIRFKDASEKKFKVEATYTVSADQTHILNQSEDARLTIYTCIGFLDSKRFVVIAIPN